MGLPFTIKHVVRSFPTIFFVSDQCVLMNRIIFLEWWTNFGSAAYVELNFGWTNLYLFLKHVKFSF